MRVDLISREYPPEIYGGAGVHVAELVRALRPSLDVVVRCFGNPRDEADVHAYGIPAELAGANPALSTLGVDVEPEYETYLQRFPLPQRAVVKA